MTKKELKEKLDTLIELETRSCSMDPALITPEYVYQMWGGKVPFEDIQILMKDGHQNR